MNFIGTIACLLAAWDCGEKALGMTAQTLFSSGDLWLWWIPAVAWIVVSIGQFTRRAA